MLFVYEECTFVPHNFRTSPLYLFKYFSTFTMTQCSLATIGLHLASTCVSAQHFSNIKHLNFLNGRVISHWLTASCRIEECFNSANHAVLSSLTLWPTNHENGFLPIFSCTRLLDSGQCAYFLSYLSSSTVSSTTRVEQTYPEIQNA